MTCNEVVAPKRRIVMEKPLFVITDPGTATLVTGAYAIVIDKKTGKIIKIVPEMPILEKQAEAIAAGVDILRTTEGVKAAEELRVQAAKYLASVVQTVTAEVAGRTTIREH